MPESVKVRIAVVLDDEGKYLAYGTNGDNTDQDRQDQYSIERMYEEFENYSNSRNTHIKFLEINLPVPHTDAVNIEAMPDNSPRPGIRLSEPE